MSKDSLETFIEKVRLTWGPLSSELVESCRRYSEELLTAPSIEEWLAALIRDVPANQGTLSRSLAWLRAVGARRIRRPLQAAARSRQGPGDLCGAAG